MLSLAIIGEQIAVRRRELGLTQAALARKAAIGHSTLDALENSRLGELGYTKVARILSSLGLELKLQEATTRRPTLDDLLAEERDERNVR
jgi:transcriptional regulator with XRE-family HTH domain